MFITWMLCCRPIEKYWTPWVPGTCIDQTAPDLAGGPFNFITDFIIFLLPQRVIWKLHMSVEKRVGVSVIFAVGLLYVEP